MNHLKNIVSAHNSINGYIDFLMKNSIIHEMTKKDFKN